MTSVIFVFELMYNLITLDASMYHDHSDGVDLFASAYLSKYISKVN